MSNKEKKSNIDTIISFIILKKIVTPIIHSKAYKMRLVDSSGKIIKEPKTDEENESLTLLDKIIFKIKRLLGGRLLNLNNFLYLNTINNNFYNKLVVRGTIQQKAEIKRIAKEVKGIKEKFNIETDEIIYTLINEELENDF